MFAWNVFLLSSISENLFVRVADICCCYFRGSPFCRYLTFCFVDSIISVEKSAFSHVVTSLKVLCIFFLWLLFMIFSFFDFLALLLWCALMWFSLYLSFRGLQYCLHLWLDVSWILEIFFQILLLSFFLFFFLGSSNRYARHFSVPHISFSLHASGWINSSDLTSRLLTLFWPMYICC